MPDDRTCDIYRCPLRAVATVELETVEYVFCVRHVKPHTDQARPL